MVLFGRKFRMKLQLNNFCWKSEKILLTGTKQWAIPPACALTGGHPEITGVFNQKSYREMSLVKLNGKHCFALQSSWLQKMYLACKNISVIISATVNWCFRDRHKGRSLGLALMCERDQRHQDLTWSTLRRESTLKEKWMWTKKGVCQKPKRRFSFFPFF